MKYLWFYLALCVAAALGFLVAAMLAAGSQGGKDE